METALTIAGSDSSGGAGIQADIKTMIANGVYAIQIDSETKMEKAAELLSKVFGCAVLIKGGHAEIDADDFLYENDGKSRWYRGRKIDNPNTHGTGCTLSAAICSNLARGSTIQESIRDAKRYITGALAHDYAISKNLKIG